MQTADTNTLALIEHRLSSIEDSHSDLKDAIKDLTVAINKLAIIDERQVQSALVLDKLAGSVDKAHTRIDGLITEFAKAIDKVKEESTAHREEIEKRLLDLERNEPMQKKTTEWVDKIQWLIVGAVITSLVSVVVMKP